MSKNYYAILMAGGIGSRFWPVSTTEFPKQFHDMLGTGETLIQKTFNRLSRIIPEENILILTHERYKDLVLEQLPRANPGQILLEPAMRNTAPCILYASMKIQKENPDAVILVAPSDHWIEQEEEFTAEVRHCFDTCAKKNILMTLGIAPTFPNTGYGYIQYDASSGEDDGIKKVMKFTEKPTYETAKEFLEKGNYLWNAGIFIWSVKSILEAFRNFQPDMYQLFLKGNNKYNTLAERTFIRKNYQKAENISIDYAILERSDNIHVLPADFDWNDLGTWGSLYEKLPKDNAGNAVVNARTLMEDAGNNMIRTTGKKLVVIDGLDDYIVVEKKKVLLIYPKQKEQNIKEILQKVKQKFGEDLI
ncbi:mannose-1-phosphate guanylyltransferase [Sinomicrobium weinanense]|uniref:mannose-1-phosphate guanylyltransferase n=1 Tax=Sinomicrobium weinanense TaxID=2842200 RepID=A0A926JVE5_9FLAO|nr:mannose-1-phosphate guanylyltransferase [Sinomicrobium weinanense]MBC9798300.1 mannose-1-phosphate guanylyltransferase [Sinomicrobium weinanense]MBU3124543.1 mannose-1-phosphate guanylyltransferase [Sinomicrobium weinanense]